ncbi:hypothetical protein D3C85_1499210 [compost metagenome]
MFGPAEQVLQAHDQQPAVASAFIDALGAFACAFVLTGRGRQRFFRLVTEVGSLGAGEVLRRVQPQRQRPGRPFAAGKVLDTAGLAQRLA